MTEQEIRNLDTRALIAIKRSTSREGSFAQQLQWATDELNRRRKPAHSEIALVEVRDFVAGV